MILCKDENCSLAELYERYGIRVVSLIMDLVFWIKKFFGRFADQRIEFFKRWANIGQPVVSYLTSEQLISYVERIPNTQILVKKRVDESRLGFVLSRVGMGIIVEKIA